MSLLSLYNKRITWYIVYKNSTSNTKDLGVNGPDTFFEILLAHVGTLQDDVEI